MKSISSRLSLLLACGAAAYGVAACGTTDHDDGSDPPDTTAPSDPAGDPTATDGAIGNAASSLPECKAQRAVYIIAGNGSLSWFTLVWPLPSVITGFQPQYAYDDPTKVKDLTAAGHPLYGRKLGTRAVWEGRGTSPQPTALIAGINETHTNAPTNIMNNTATNLAGQAAAIQSTLPSTIPVITFGVAGPYLAVPGAPLAYNVAALNDAIAAFTGKVTPAQQAALQPTADQIARYVPAGATTAEADFGNQLAFAANAFKLGLVNTVMLPGFRDDPHGAFAAGAAAAGTRADHLAATLDAFYTDLNAVNEPSCSHAGQTVKLADNVVTIVDGDTPKNSFNQSGWPDGTVGNSNFLYLRSNGFTKPGWFGDIQPTLRTPFNPTTGATDATATPASDTAAAYASVLYAIARGDKTRVQTVTAAAFDGVAK